MGNGSAPDSNFWINLADWRGQCPEADQLLDFAAGRLPEPAAQRVREHLKVCTLCEDIAARARQPVSEVDELAWQRARRSLDRRQAPWSRSPKQMPRAWAAAAMMIVAAGVVIWLAPGTHEPPAPQTRGAAMLAIEPVGTVNKVEWFRWTTQPMAAAYEVRLDGPGGVQEWRRLDVSEVRLERALNQPGRYRWQVVAVDDDGEPFARSDWMEFELRPE